MYLICLDLLPPRRGESRKAITTMAISAQTIGRDQLWGPLGIAGGRPRPCGDELGWRFTGAPPSAAARESGELSHWFARVARSRRQCYGLRPLTVFRGIRVLAGIGGYVARSWSAPAPACGPAAAPPPKPR